MAKRELRFGEKLEVRTVGGKRKIAGYAAVFNSLSNPLGGFREKIAPGAFRNAIANDDVRALVDHNPAMIIGRTKSGTLSLREDDHGLYCEIDPPDTTIGNDLIESLNRGDLDQMSFGFSVVDDDWTKNENGDCIRELREVRLFDVSVVAYPAYDATTVSMRSLLFPEGEPEIRHPEEREAKTKKVDGKDLTASDFAHVGDPQDPSTWKLPIFDAAHVRNALARFNQVQGLSEEEKKAAWKKIVAAAKKFNIDISEENSLKLYNAETTKAARALVRQMDPDGDGDDDEALMDALMDSYWGCGAVCRTLGSCMDSCMSGESDYTDPLLEAFTKQAQVLIADLNVAIAEAKKELNEPAPTPELNSRWKRYQEKFVSKK